LRFQLRALIETDSKKTTRGLNGEKGKKKKEETCSTNLNKNSSCRVGLRPVSQSKNLAILGGKNGH